jgi:hypothetical protein
MERRRKQALNKRAAAAGTALVPSNGPPSNINGMMTHRVEGDASNLLTNPNPLQDNAIDMATNPDAPRVG